MARRERLLAWQVDAAWAVKPEAEENLSGVLKFPFIDGITLSKAGTLPKSARAFCADRVLSIFNECRRIAAPDVHDAVLIPVTASAMLVDVVDMTINNFMYSNQDGVQSLRMIDFEPHSNHNRLRNYRNMAQALWLLREKRMLAAVFWLRYIAGSVCCAIQYQCKTVDERIRDRQPSIGALLLIHGRDVVEGCLVRIFPRLKER